MPARCEIADAVASHVGPAEWGYDGPEPETPLQQLVYQAGKATTSGLDPGVGSPCRYDRFDTQCRRSIPPAQSPKNWPLWGWKRVISNHSQPQRR